jgi:hypothetical protein
MYLRLEISEDEEVLTELMVLATKPTKKKQYSSTLKATCLPETSVAFSMDYTAL